MDEDRLRNDVKVEADELDVAALEQAEAYSHWAQASAKAKAALDDTELDHEILTAKLQMNIRADPTEYGINSVTEKAIESTVKTLTEWQVSQRKVNTAACEAALCDKAERAMGQRKSMIEELVRLHGQQYFAGPDVPHNLMELWAERRKLRAEATQAPQYKEVRRPGEVRRAREKR